MHVLWLALVDYPTLVMGFPTLKRENTVAIRFTKGQVEDSHYREIIYHTLGVENDEVYGIASMGVKRFMLKVSTWSTYNRIVKDFVGKYFVIDDDHEYEIDDLSTYKNRVKVTKVPFEMSEGDLKILLERYGKVENIITSHKKFGDYNNIVSDERIVWMVVEFGIPSSLYINDSETYIYFSYIQQPRTCHKCGSHDHTVNQCDVSRSTKPKDRENAITIYPIPARDDRARRASESSVDTNTDFEDSKSVLTSEPEADNIVVMLDPTANMSESQRERPSSCKEGDKTSEAEDDLDSHMADHTGEAQVVDDDSGDWEALLLQRAERLIPKPRNAPISNSQPINNAPQDIKKRNLSLSPQNVNAHQSNPRSIKTLRFGDLV